MKYDEYDDEIDCLFGWLVITQCGLHASLRFYALLCAVSLFQQNGPHTGLYPSIRFHCNHVLDHHHLIHQTGGGGGRVKAGNCFYWEITSPYDQLTS